MNRIKKFNEDLDEENNEFSVPFAKDNGNGLGKYAKAHFIADKLKDGYAISISKGKVADFFDILKDIHWIEVPKNPENYTDEWYYFVLFGSRLLHSDKPEFGGNKLEVYNI